MGRVGVAWMALSTAVAAACSTAPSAGPPAGSKALETDVDAALGHAPAAGEAPASGTGGLGTHDAGMAGAVRDAGQADAAPGLDGATPGDAAAGAALDGAAVTTAQDAGAAAQDGAMPQEQPDLRLPEALFDGVWYVGWWGSLDHFSWMRFSPGTSRTTGTWMAAPPSCTLCAPYIVCLAGGTFVYDPVLSHLLLTAPTQCTGGEPRQLTWSVHIIGAPPVSQLPAEMEAIFRDMERDRQLNGFRYPPDHCTSDLARCDDPYAP